MVDKINMVIECIVMILKMNKYVLKFFLFNIYVWVFREMCIV